MILSRVCSKVLLLNANWPCAIHRALESSPNQARWWRHPSWRKGVQRGPVLPCGGEDERMSDSAGKEEEKRSVRHAAHESEGPASGWRRRSSPMSAIKWFYSRLTDLAQSIWWSWKCCRSMVKLLLSPSGRDLLRNSMSLVIRDGHHRRQLNFQSGCGGGG